MSVICERMRETRSFDGLTSDILRFFTPTLSRELTGIN